MIGSPAMNKFGVAVIWENLETGEKLYQPLPEKLPPEPPAPIRALGPDKARLPGLIRALGPDKARLISLVEFARPTGERVFMAAVDLEDLEPEVEKQPSTKKPGPKKKLSRATSGGRKKGRTRNR